MRGPVDYIIVGFEGNKFDGSILKALGDALDKQIISLVALSVISKDSDGVTSTLNIEDIGDELISEFTQKYPVSSPDQVDSEDINEVADLIQNNCTAGLLVVEHLWARPLKKAIVDANGILIAEGRIHPDSQVEIEASK